MTLPEIGSPPNPRLQRTPSAPLSRQPLAGSRMLVLFSALVVLGGCASVAAHSTTANEVVRHFAAQGFPTTRLVDVYTIFPETELDRYFDLGTTDVWVSPLEREVVYFQGDRCAQDNSDILLENVLMSCRRSDARAAAEQVRQWLAIANPSLHLPGDFESDPKNALFEATWSVDGRTVHVKAWLAQAARYWMGVFNIYSHEVVMVSEGPTLGKH